MFHGGSSLRNVFNKSKNFQKFKKAQNRSQFVQKCSEHVLGYFFEKILLPSVPWRVESSKCFQKIKNFSKLLNCPKSFPKCPNVFWTCFEVNFSKKYFCRVFHGGSSLRKVFKKSKIFQNYVIAQNCSQKCANVFWTCFGVIFPESFFCPVFHGGSSLRNVFKKSKYFQNSKNAQNRSRKYPNAFWTSFGVIFSKNFFAQCSMEGRVFEMLLTKLKKFRIPKTYKIVPKPSKIVLNMFWVTFLEKLFLPSVRWKVESSKCFQKIKKLSKFRECLKSFTKVSKHV